MQAGFFAAFVGATLLLGAGIAQAKPELRMVMVTEKEVTVTEGGKPVLKRLRAQSTASGEVLIYTLNYQNVGKEKATAVNVDNPLPQGTRYLANSASGPATRIKFSVDGGKTYAAPDRLLVQKTGKKAAAVDYTHIRWMLGEIKPGQSGQLIFRAQVE